MYCMATGPAAVTPPVRGENGDGGVDVSFFEFCCDAPTFVAAGSHGAANS